MENKNIESMHHKFYEWEKKPNFLEELREYFETTSREQILKDWEKTSVYDSGNVTADKFINFLEQRRKVIESTNNVISADDFVLETNELEEDETVKLVNKLLEFQEGLKLYNREFNIFGDDITQVADYYIENNFEISVDWENKYLNWEITCNDGDNVVIHKTGYVDFFWLEGGDIDEQKEMKKVLINELRHLIEDRELVDVKNRTITLLEEKEVEELKRVLEKLNS